MSNTPRAFVLFLVVLLILPGLGATVVEGSAANDSKCISESDHQVGSPSLPATVSQPNNTTDTIRISYEAQRTSLGFKVRIPPESELVQKVGFEKRNAREGYYYTGVDRPFIEYRPREGSNVWRMMREEQWTFSPMPEHYGANVIFNPSPSGVVGDQYVYLGNYSSYSESVGCHTITVIVSDASQDEISGREILDTLVYAAQNVAVSHRYDEVRIFALPTRPDLSVHGTAYENEAWIWSQGGSVNDSHIAVHEYIHTRQAFDSSGIAGMLWFTEGSAEYLSLRIIHERGILSASRYNEILREGSELNATLTNRSTWPNRGVKYTRGGAFVAILDSKLRGATGGEYTVVDLIRTINTKTTESRIIDVRRGKFLDEIQNNSNKSVAKWANESLDSSESWDHESATVKEQSFWSKAVKGLRERIQEDPLNWTLIAAFFGFSVGVALIDKQEGSKSD